MVTPYPQLSMREEQFQKEAKEFLKQVEDVLIDDGCLGWRWRPFNPPSGSETRAIRLRRNLRELREALYRNPERSIGLAEAIVHDGGFTLEQGCLAAAEDRYHFAFKGHQAQLTKFGRTVEQFERDFERFAPWSETGNDIHWDALRDRIVASKRATRDEVQDWTLMDIWDYLVRPEPDDLAKPSKESEALNYFRRRGDVWEICFGGVSKPVKHSLGLSYIALMLHPSNRDKRIDPSDLMLQIKGKSREHNEEDLQDDWILDPKAGRQYKARVAELKDQIEIAESTGNTSEVSRLRSDLDIIKSERKKAFNVHKRPRPLLPHGNVTSANAIRRAIYRAYDGLFKAGMPELATHLQKSIKARGSVWRGYRADPPLDWDVALTSEKN